MGSGQSLQRVAVLSGADSGQVTLRLAGLLEGRIPPTPDFPERLERFEREARAVGLHLALEVDGGRFGFLGDEVLRAWPELGAEPEQVLAEQLEDLLRAFPDRSSLFSTLRTTQTRGTARIRTLFAVRPDGSIEQAQERDVLEAPLRLSSAPSRLRTWLPPTLVALGLGGAYVGDLLGLRTQFLAASQLRAAPTIESVEVVDFGQAIELVDFEVTGTPPHLLLRLRRGSEFPAGGRADLQAQTAGEETLGRRLITEALAGGVGRLSVFDGRGAGLEVLSIPIGGLFEEETIEVLLPMGRLAGARSVQLSP